MIDINKILAKHFTKDLTPQEEEIVVKWKDKHKEEYEQLKSIMTHTQLVDHKEKFCISEGWDSLEKEIGDQNKSSFVRKSFSYFKAWQVAASILIFVSVTFTLLWNQNDSEMMIASSIKQMQLSDGSEVTLNKNARLYYPRKFGDKKRELTLKGEAFFNVQPDKNRPFQINVNGTKITVLGTSFNINSKGNSVIVVVKTGKVSFSTEAGDEVFLEAGEKGFFKDAILRKTINDDANFIAWKTKVFHFEKKSLSFILAELERIYGETILVKGDFSNCYATINFENQTLEESLTELQLLFEFKITTKNNIIEINDINCSEH